jgi:hypothetical protein
MTAQKLLFVASLVAALPPWTEAGDRRPEHHRGQVEPHAGQWKTWVISSGRDYRVPPPPSPWQTAWAWSCRCMLSDAPFAPAIQTILDFTALRLR